MLGDNEGETASRKEGRWFSSNTIVGRLHRSYDMRTFAKDCKVDISWCSARKQLRIGPTQRTVVAGHLAVWTASFKCYSADSTDILFIVVVLVCVIVDGRVAHRRIPFSLVLLANLPTPACDSIVRLDLDLHCGVGTVIELNS